MAKIGVETHLQLNSNTKMFCGCPTTGSDKPNTRVCDTCLGMPGSKPRANKKVIEMAVKVAKALNCEIPSEIQFSRKNYFYPDMSKNFQITQYEVPIGEKGYINLNGKKISIKRINLEEDPARLVHIGGGINSASYVLVDYNRSGIPLCEIVTEPDLKSPKEARSLVFKLANIMEYLKVYDDKTGILKSDANISTEGEKVEVKNITGKREIEGALKYEITRQKNMVRRGKSIEMETRSWDSSANVTRGLRAKETEEDYGYIFEPDLTKVTLGKKWVKKLTRNIPELPDEKREKYMKNFGIGKELATSITSDFELTQVFEKLSKKLPPGKVADFLGGPLKKTLNYNNLKFSETGLDESYIHKLIKMVLDEKITERNGELILREIVLKPQDPEKLVEKRGLEKVSAKEDDIKKVIEENKKAVEDYKQGREKSLNFLVGEVMKKTKGKVDPKKARELLKKEIK